MKSRLISLFFLVAALLSVSSHAENAPPPAKDVFLFSANYQDPNGFILNWEIKPGFFLYADRIKLSSSKNSNASSNIIHFPDSLKKTDKQGKTYEIYRGKLSLPVAVLASEPGETLVKLHYQGCSDDGFCYPPVTKQLRLTVNDKNELSAVQLEAQAIKAKPPLKKPQRIQSAEEKVFDQSLLMIVFSFFGFGLLLAFTPCVLPMVPVLSGIIVGHGKEISGRKAFFLSLSYVLSMSFTYALIGAVVAELGANLQVLMQSPWTIIIFSLLFVLLSLSMFGLYELKLPTSWQAKLASASRSQASGHYLSAAIMGCLSTLILSPCVTAPLIGALSYIAHSGDLILGMVALFFLGLGMGLPLLLIGTSAGKLLPKAGDWMNTVKYFFGFLLLAVAIYLLERVLPPFTTMLLWAALFIFAGVYSGAVNFSPRQHKFSQGLGIMLLVYGLLILIGASMGSHNPLMPLERLSSTASRPAFGQSEPPHGISVSTLAALKKQMATARGKPVVVDFYADWCASCKAMEATTLQDAKVRKALKKVVWIKADVTANNHSTDRLMKAFNVIAPPTFVFFNAQGKALPALRQVGEVDADEFLNVLKKLKKNKAK